MNPPRRSDVEKEYSEARSAHLAALQRLKAAKLALAPYLAADEEAAKQERLARDIQAFEMWLAGATESVASQAMGYKSPSGFRGQRYHFIWKNTKNCGPEIYEMSERDRLRLALTEHRAQLAISAFGTEAMEDMT